MTGQIEQYLEQELASLKQQLAEAKKDAERYRWAKENHAVISFYSPDANKRLVFTKNMDAAIDQAMRDRHEQN